MKYKDTLKPRHANGILGPPSRARPQNICLHHSPQLTSIVLFQDAIKGAFQNFI